jgi:hypothetical protein
MSRQRVTEDFVKMFRALESATTSNPQKLEEALRSDPSLTHIVRELHTLFLRIENHRKYSKRRVILQAHPEFLDAIVRYRGSWADSWLATLPEIDFSDLLIGVPASTNSEPSDAIGGEEELWDFDPDSHSAADHIDGVMENASISQMNIHSFLVLNKLGLGYAKQWI